MENTNSTRNKFKDTMERWLTSGLFYEATPRSDVEFALFTLRDEDRVVKGKKLLSIRKLFMSCSDPTEYEFATKHLGGWEHWKAIQESPPLQSYIAQWRDEFEIMLRSEAIKKIANLANGEKGYQAARFLADCGWKLRAAGAPSKEEKEGEKRKALAVSNALANDAERIGLIRIK